MHVSRDRIDGREEQIKASFSLRKILSLTSVVFLFIFDIYCSITN